MAKVIEVAGRHAVIGIDWSLQPNAAGKAAALKKAGRRVYYYSKLVFDGATLGIANGITPPKGAFPAAVAVGDAHSEAIIYQELEDGSVWVCSIMGGAPLPGSDRIVDTVDEARGIVSEEMANHPSAKLFGSLSGAAKPIDRVIEELPPAAFKKLGFRQSGISRVLVAVLVLGPLLAGAGVYGYVLLSQRNEAIRRATESAQATLARQQSENSAVAKLVDDFKAQVAQAKKSMDWGVPASVQLGLLSETISSMPLNHEGYKLHSAVCDSRTEEPACTLTWTASAVAGARPLVTSALTVPGTSTATDSSPQAALMAAVTSVVKSKATSAVEIQQFGPGDRLALISRMQRIGIDLQFEPHASVTVTPDPRAAKLAGDPVTVGQKGKWRTELATSAHLAAFTEAIAGSSLRLSQLRMDGMSQFKPRYSLEGDYVVSASAQK